MAVYGADVAELRQLAKAFAEAGTRLTDAQGAVTAQVQSSPWRGPDAEQFRHEWAGRHVSRLLAAARALESNAVALVKNADEQERTSTDDGGGGGSGAGAGGSGAPGSGGSGSGSSGSGSSDPGALPTPEPGAPAADAAAWWRSLSPEEQQAMIDFDPSLVGSLDGLPGAVRDEANREVLADSIEELRAVPVPADPYARIAVLERLAALENVQRVLDDTDGTTLLMFDPDVPGSPQVAIGFGDVDSADHVGVYTQGMNSGVDGGSGLTDPARDMVNLQAELDQRLASAGAGETGAMVMWMGYDAPSPLTVAFPQQGIAGAAGLADFADGLRANNDGAHITGLGHSYGSFVTGVAGQQTDAFDDLVFFGSPGIGTDDISELRIDGGNAYVLEADGDPVADAGRFGTDPNQLPGVINLNSDATDTLEGSNGHSGYLTDGTASQYNMAAVVAGDGQDAGRGGNAGLGDALRWVLGQL